MANGFFINGYFFLAFLIFTLYLCEVNYKFFKMKKFYLFLIALAVTFTVKAQWVNDPVNNTLIANTSADAGEIYLAYNSHTGDTYMQWCSFVGGNGWSPTLQRLNFAGEPQWGPNGIHISGHQFSSMSEGVAMTTTTDGGVVSCFSVYDGYTYAVKINPDGTFAWGEQGVQLFGGLGFSRAEVIATDDGGIWALGFDYQNLYLQYLNNATGPVITISDAGGYRCMYGQLTLSYDNRVFVTYEKCGNGLYTDKEIYVAGYNPDGTQFSQETLLMSSKTFQVTYLHHALSDGMGGGYIYIWHPGIGDAFNTYVFHFDQFGASTIGSNGAPVHTTDPTYYYIDANATVDPVTHDIIIGYRQTDAEFESEHRLYVNRITPFGEIIWGEGMLVLDNGSAPFAKIRVDAFEYGDGFSVIYIKGQSPTSDASTVEAQGFDMKGDALWSTQMCSSTYSKTGCENTSGFHGGQNIFTWINSTGAVSGSGPGGLYGQNIGQNGEMGEVTPPTPPTPCYPPTNLQGESYYNAETGISAAVVSWTAPDTTPLHYNLYCESLKEVIEIDPEYTSYYYELEPGDYIFKLTAWYEDCESDFALTENGDNYILIEIQNHESVSEIDYEEIVNIIEIYNVNGQRVNAKDIQELNQGMFIIKGVTQSGKITTRKIVR